MKQLISIFIVISIAFFSVPLQGQSNAGQQTKKGAGKGALIGAVAAAVFGDGDLIGDVVEGAAIGAGVGAFAGFLDGKSMDKQQQKEFEELVATFGEDNIRGYVELLQCNHSKAIALFRVEQESSNNEHSLTGVWMEGIAEKDRRNKDRISELLNKIVELDHDMDDLQMASIAVDQYVIDLRNDRKANKLPSCN